MAACAAWSPVQESNLLDLAELQDRIHALTGGIPLQEGHGRKGKEHNEKRTLIYARDQQL